MSHFDRDIGFNFNSVDEAMKIVLEFFLQGMEYLTPYQITLCFTSNKLENEFISRITEKIIMDGYNRGFFDFLTILNNPMVKQVPTIEKQGVPFVKQFTLKQTNTAQQIMSCIWRMSQRPLSFLFHRIPQTIYNSLYISSYAAAYPLFLVTTMVDTKQSANQGFYMFSG